MYVQKHSTIATLYKKPVTCDQFCLDVAYLRRYIAEDHLQIDDQNVSSSASFCPTSVQTNIMRKRASEWFGLPSVSSFLANGTHGETKQQDTPIATMVCTKITHPDKELEIDVQDDDWTSQFFNPFQQTFRYQEEDKQCIEAIQFLSKVRRLNNNTIPRSQEDMLADFYSLRGPVWGSAVSIIRFQTKSATTLPFYTAVHLAQILKQNARKTQTNREVDALIVQGVLADILQDGIAGGDNDDDENNDDEYSDDAFLSVVPTDDEGHLDFITALQTLLLDSGVTAMEAIRRNQELSAAGIRRHGKDIYTALEAIMVQVACSSGYSGSRFRTDVFAPVKQLLLNLGIDQSLKSAEYYLPKNHPVYVKSIALYNTLVSGGAAQGEGAHGNLLTVMEMEFDNTIDGYVKMTRRHGLKPSLAIKPRAPMAVMVDAASKRMSALENTTGQMSDTTIALSFPGDGEGSMVGQGMIPLGMWMGKDNHACLSKQFETHQQQLKDLYDEEIKIYDITRERDTTICPRFPIDGAAQRAMKGLPAANSNNPLGFNPAPKWTFKSAYFNEIPMTGIAEFPWESAWKGKEELESIILDEFDGVILLKPVISPKMLRYIYQSCFHAVGTAGKYLMKVLYRFAHQLGTAHQLSAIIKQVSGYTLRYDTAKVNGNNTVILSGGLSAGMYIELLCTWYEEIVDAVFIGVNPTTDPTILEAVVAQVKTIFSDFAINSTMVLLARSYEFEVYQHYLQTFVAREHTWQAKFCVIFDSIYITPTMMERKWVHARHANEAVTDFGICLPYFGNEERIEEVHQLVHEVQDRVRFLSAGKKSKQVQSVLAHMALERYFRYLRAGGRRNYAKKNAKKKTDKIAGRRRKGIGFDGIYAKKWSAIEHQRWMDHNGDENEIDEDACPSYIHPTNPLIKSEYVERSEEEEEFSEEEEEEEEEDMYLERTTRTRRKPNRFDSSSSEEEEFEEEPAVYDGDIEMDKTMAKRIDRFNQRSGTKVAPTPKASGTKTNMTFGTMVADRVMTTIMCGTRRIQIDLSGGNSLKKLVIERKRIARIYIVDRGRSVTKTVDVVESEEEEDDEEGSEEGDDEDDEEGSEEGSDEHDDEHDDENSEQEEDTHSKRKREQGTTPKKRRKKRRTNRIKKRNRTVTITIDLLTPPHLEEGTKTLKTSKTGKQTNRTDWNLSGDTLEQVARVTLFLYTAGGATRNKAQNKFIRTIKQFINLSNKGDGEWSIDLSTADPPTMAPTIDDDAWKARKEASEYKFRGMGLSEAVSHEPGTARDELVSNLLVRLLKIDTDFYDWAEGKRPLFYDDPQDAQCKCVNCGCQIVLPCYSEERDYPDAACCPLWCRVEDDSDPDALVLETHMQCNSIKMAPHLQEVKEINNARVDIPDSQEETSSDTTSSDSTSSDSSSMEDEDGEERGGDEN